MKCCQTARRQCLRQMIDKRIDKCGRNALEHHGQVLWRVVGAQQREESGGATFIIDSVDARGVRSVGTRRLRRRCIVTSRRRYAFRAKQTTYEYKKLHSSCRML